MKTFFHEETGGNQFALTYTFGATSAPDSAVLPVIFWLTYRSASAVDVIELFFQHPDADAQHRLELRNDVLSGNTTQEFHLHCGKGGVIVPRGATAPADGSTQLSDGVPWSLRLITTLKTGDAFLDFGWDWQGVG